MGVWRSLLFLLCKVLDRVTSLCWILTYNLGRWALKRNFHYYYGGQLCSYECHYERSAYGFTSNLSCWINLKGFWEEDLLKWSWGLGGQWVLWIYQIFRLWSLHSGPNNNFYWENIRPNHIRLLLVWSEDHLKKCLQIFWEKILTWTNFWLSWGGNVACLWLREGSYKSDLRNKVETHKISINKEQFI